MLSAARSATPVTCGHENGFTRISAQNLKEKSQSFFYLTCENEADKSAALLLSPFKYHIL